MRAAGENLPPALSQRLRNAARAAWPGRLGVGAVAVVASAALAVSALPPADLGVLAFVALVPLMVACRNLGAAPGAALGWAFGVLSSLGIYRWLLEVPAIGALHMGVLAAYVALYPAAWCALLPRLRRSRLPFVLSAPAAWVAIDWARSHASFLALPWGTLAHTQHDNLALLQLASVAGEAGVSYVVVMVNVALASVCATRQFRPLGAATSVALVVHLGGLAALWSVPAGDSVRVAAVQPAVPVDARRTPDQRAAIWQRLEALTLDVARAHPAVIVWPETAVSDPQFSVELSRQLAQLAVRVDAPLIVGAAQLEKFATRRADNEVAMALRQTHNAAYLVRPGADPSEPYRKRRLVPFAEYVPRPGAFSWPAWLVGPGLASLQVGPATPQHWTLPDGTRVAALICWENLFADLARDAARDGAQLLVQLTNDAWFGPTAAGRQHNLASVLRAVENRVPVVIASNTGPSQVIDAHGRVVASIDEPFSAGAAVGAVARGGGSTVFQRTGTAWLASALVLSVVACGLPRGRGVERRSMRRIEGNAMRSRP